MKYSHSKAMAVFYKIVKLVKNGVLMIIHIYAKVSFYKIDRKLIKNIRKTTNQARLLIINSFIMQIKDLTGYNMTEKSIGRLGW